ALGLRDRVDPLEVQLGVDGVGADLAGMDLPPDLAEAVVVLPPAQRTGPMARGKGGGLVQEEQLGEATGLHHRAALPAAELEPAGNPAAAVVAPPDSLLGIVQA